MRFEPEQQAAALTAEVFINAYLRALDGEISTPMEAVEWVKRHPLATETFKTRLETLYREAYESDPDLGYGADAVIAAQDFPTNYRVTSVHLEGNRAIVDLEGVNADDEPLGGFSLRMVLVRSERFWLVDASGALVEMDSEPQPTSEPVD